MGSKNQPPGPIVKEFQNGFFIRSDMDDGSGCPTCGRGAERGMSKEAFDRLLADIDQWIAETFGKETPHG